MPIKQLVITVLFVTVIVGLSACKSETTTTATASGSLSATHSAALLTPPTDISIPEETPCREFLLTHTLHGNFYDPEQNEWRFTIRFSEIAALFVAEVKAGDGLPYEFQAYFEENRAVIPYYNQLTIACTGNSAVGEWAFEGHFYEIDFTARKRADPEATIYDNIPSSIKLFKGHLPASTNIKTKEEFKNYLSKNSPFEGVWKGTSPKADPTESEGRVTVHFMKEEDGNLSIIGNKEADVQVRKVADRFFVAFRTLSGGYARLELQKNGVLRGIYHHPVLSHNNQNGKIVGRQAYYWEILPNIY